MFEDIINMKHFQKNIMAVFGYDIKYVLENINNNKINGYFYKSEDDKFKLPFEIDLNYPTEQRSISVKLYVFVRYDFEQNNKFEKQNVIIAKNITLTGKEFNSYIAKIREYFNQSINNSLNIFFNNIYFIDNIDSVNEDKRGYIDLTITSNDITAYSLNFGTSQNYICPQDKNKYNVKIDFDDNYITMINTKYKFSNSMAHSNSVENIVAHFNSYYNLNSPCILNTSDFNSFSTMNDIFSKIADLKAVNTILTY